MATRKEKIREDIEQEVEKIDVSRMFGYDWITCPLQDLDMMFLKMGVIPKPKKNMIDYKKYPANWKTEIKF